jgi:hypothetical protein
MRACQKSLWLALALLAAQAANAQQVNYPLDAETLKDTMRTRDPDEEIYLTYVAALVEQGQLSRDLVASTLKWAMRKPDPKKTQYFKQALILRANDAGVMLPRDTPSLVGTIEGRCYVRVLVVDVPAPGVTVTLGNTKRTAVTDAQGRFQFNDVPYGIYRLEATGMITLTRRIGSAQVTIPTPPPSTASARVSMELR